MHKFEWGTTKIYSVSYKHPNFQAELWSLNHSLYELSTCDHHACENYITTKLRSNVCHYNNPNTVTSYVRGQQS
jgi:hypothetical protein